MRAEIKDVNPEGAKHSLRVTRPEPNPSSAMCKLCDLGLGSIVHSFDNVPLSTSPMAVSALGSGDKSVNIIKIPDLVDMAFYKNDQPK